MNDTEVRVRCVEAAARVPGNPNTVLQAREFYAFVTEGPTTFMAVKEALGDEATIVNSTTVIAPKGQKGSRK